MSGQASSPRPTRELTLQGKREITGGLERLLACPCPFMTIIHVDGAKIVAEERQGSGNHQDRHACSERQAPHDGLAAKHVPQGRHHSAPDY